MAYDIGLATGMSNDEIADALKQYHMKSAVIWMGIDSLTIGSGGFSYNIPFEKFARGASGWGGRYVPFAAFNPVTELNSGFKTGYTELTTLDRSDTRRAMSLDGKGAFSDATGTEFVYQVFPDWNWATVDIYYLKQPGGGTIRIDYPTNVEAVTFSTDSGDASYSIGVISVVQATKGDPSPIQSIRMGNNSLDGPICVYGAMFNSGDNGPKFINAATGGQKASEFVEYTSSAQQEWFELLGVTHAIMNAGTNDRATSTPSEFEADLREICGRFDSSVTQYIVRPNDTDGSAPFDAVYPAVAADFGEYIDLPTLYGDYAKNLAEGRMLDGTHPNGNYQYYQAQHYCSLLFGNALYVETPPIIDYSATDTQALIDGSFKSLIARVETLEP